MAITANDIKRELKPWILSLIQAGGGVPGPYIGGSGTAGQVAYFSATTTITSSSLFTWDNTNKVLTVTGTYGNLYFQGIGPTIGGAAENSSGFVLSSVAGAGNKVNFWTRGPTGGGDQLGVTGDYAAGGNRYVLMSTFPVGSPAIGSGFQSSATDQANAPYAVWITGGTITKIGLRNHTDFSMGVWDGSTLTSTTLTHSTSTGNTVTGGTMQATAYTSTIAIGTSPYACTSTTLNTNLNADLLDGLHASSLGGTLTDKYIAYGTGTGITGEAAYTYDASTNTQKVDYLYARFGLYNYDPDTPDMGYNQDSAVNGYGLAYVTDKTLSNCAIGSNADPKNGAIRVDFADDPDSLEVYMRSTGWYTIIYDLTTQYGDFRHTPLSEQIYVWRGDSVRTDAGGVQPAISEYQGTMGAYQTPRAIDGGSF